MSTVEFVKQAPGCGPPTPVPIYQWESEFEILLSVFRELAPKRVLEIGTFHGGTLFHWLQNIQEGGVIVSVDSYAVGVDNRHLYDSWTPEGVELIVIEGDSRSETTIGVVATEAPYDFVFIDAGHYYHEVRQDWLNYEPMVRTGGLVAFHDILPPSPEHPEIEVAQLWEELERDFDVEEIIADPNASWGGIGIVRM